jgi:mono/diheme cytochrome c family protein
VTDDRSGRELTPRPNEPESVVAPRESSLPATTDSQLPERFYAGDQAHTVGLTEERAAQIVKQSSNARMIAFLAALVFVLFIPIYWLYAIGLPVIGLDGQLEKEGNAQYVTDVKRGYALYLANCARCHDSTAAGAKPGNGLGNVGPPLNDQAKLLNAITTTGLPGTGHLNPDYIHSVLREGGRYVCGDPKSVMPAWLEPKGPLNYREVEEIIAFLLATKDTDFTYQPTHVEGGATIPPPVDVEGWRDPGFTMAPGATPVPDCWRGTTTTGGGGAATPAPVTSPGTADSPRVIEIEGTADVKWVDPATDTQLTQLSVVPGETIEFHVINNSGLQHNLHIAAEDVLSTAPQENDLPGIEPFTEGTKTFTYTVDNTDQLQFACTVLGHYVAMNGDFVAVTGGGSASPGTSPAASAPASPAAASPAAASPAASAEASPAPSVAP